MALALKGTWTATDGQKLEVVKDDGGQFVMEPVGSAWWSSATGSWKQGEGNGQGSDAPFLGTVTFKNDGDTTYECNFCVSASGQEILFANGVLCKK